MDHRFIIVAAALLAGSLQNLYADALLPLNSTGCVAKMEEGAEIATQCNEHNKDVQAMMHDQDGPGACANELQALCPATSVRAIQKCLKKQMDHIPASCRTMLALALPR